MTSFVKIVLSIRTNANPQMGPRQVSGGVSSVGMPHPLQIFYESLSEFGKKVKLGNNNVPFGWLVVLRIFLAIAVFQPYRDLEAGDNQSLKIQVAMPGIELRTSCSASHSATAAPVW